MLFEAWIQRCICGIYQPLFVDIVVVVNLPPFFFPRPNGTYILCTTSPLSLVTGFVKNTSGLPITAGQRTMSVKKRLCPVKFLNDQTFCPLFYASNVIQTFTFFKIRLVKIRHLWRSWREKSRRREKNRRRDQELLLRKPFITQGLW